jgi:molecular chaperone DnaK
MSKTINLGIDLGTTNSAIGLFDKGEITVFKDPIAWKDTIASVVSFKKDRIIVGQKAKESIEKSPQNTFGLFKRKMGTNESFKIKNLSKSVTPVELSSFILKELKTFVTDKSVNLDSAVITIPASFDTIQANATKQAGELAGFKEVVLLQEPIAASLAYANLKKQDLDQTNWIVYDLGGGTFDVALVNVNDGEMKIVDHEGDNFLGGSDFDRMIIEKIVIPYLEDNYNFTKLRAALQNSSGKHNKLYYRLLKAAEDVKIQLSSQTSADLEVEIKDDAGDLIDAEITITRDSFEKLIKSEIIKTIDMIKLILTNNSLRNSDVDFILMVGGSTYIPFVKQYISDVLKIKVNTDIDPTTAITIGASYYAGNKKRSSKNKKDVTHKESFKIKMAYEKATQENSCYLAAKVDGDVKKHSYRIIREDGGFDSGLKELASRISEDLPLLGDSYNFFKFTIYDDFNNEVQVESIEISQGKYTISGQPLSEDLCLEVDDSNSEGTKLELIFKKNTILPLKKTISKDINKTIKKHSTEELVINLLEGDSQSIPEANKTLGVIRISGADISKDILKGSDLEITIEISESRDVTVSAYVSMTDQEFKEIFTPQNRNVSVNDLALDVERLTSQIGISLDLASENNDEEKVNELKIIKADLVKLEKEVSSIDEDDTTDNPYKIEDNKRNIAKNYYSAIREEKTSTLKSEYHEIKTSVAVLVEQYATENEKEIFTELVSNEEIYLNSSNFSKIDELIDEMQVLKYQLMWRDLKFVQSMFSWVSTGSINFKDQSRADALIEKGTEFFEDAEMLSDITRDLFQLLPRDEQEKVNNKIGFY